MKRNKFVIIIALILIVGVLFFGKGVNNPISVYDKYPLFEYQATDMAYTSAKSVLGDSDDDFKMLVEKMPSDDPDDYLLADTNVDLKINTNRKIKIGAAITSESGKYQDRIIMASSYDGEMIDYERFTQSTNLDECNLVIYIGGLSKKEVKELKEDIGVMLTYKVGGYKEKNMFLSPKEYRYANEIEGLYD